MTVAGLEALEQIVVASVGMTARGVSAVSPELTLLQWRAVVVLAGRPEGLTVSELAERLGSRLPAMSRLLGRLRTRGLVEARKDRADGRVTTVALTDAGLTLWTEVTRRRREVLAEALRLAALSGDEEAALDRVGRAVAPFA